MKRLLLLVLLTLLSACGPSAPRPAPVQPTKEPVAVPTTTRAPIPTTYPTAPANAFAFEQARELGRGVNLGNALEAPKEGEWGVTLEEGFFSIIKKGGFSAVRIPINWVAHSEAKAPYTIDPAFFERVDWTVQQTLKNKLVAIINMHSFADLMESPAANKDRFVALWGQIARHYQEYPDSLYFEFLNEPNGTLGGTSAWNTLVAAALKEVRQSNPNRTIVIGPGNWNAVANLYELQLPAGDRNIIVTFHYYQPFQFTHQGAEWVADSNPWMGTTWTGKPAEQQAIDRDFDLAKKWGELNARPIFLGEFGAYSKADMESRNRWTAYVARAAEQRNFSWAYWEFCAGFGVYNRETKDWVKPIYNALIP